MSELLFYLTNLTHFVIAQHSFKLSFAHDWVALFYPFGDGVVYYPYPQELIGIL